MGRLSLIFFVFFFLVFAADHVFAADPVIDNVVINGSAFDPKEGGVIVVKVVFNVTDTDGWWTLNNSACKCEFDNNAVWDSLYESANDSLCSNTIIDINTMQYTCLVDMSFWYEPTTFSVNVTVADNPGTVVTDASQTFTYNILVASDLDASSIDFGSLDYSDLDTDKVDANSPLVINNTGNSVISLNVTGADLADSNAVAPNVSVGDFFVDVDSDIAGAVQLSYSSQLITSASVPVAASGSDGLEELWWFFSVPPALQYGLYSGAWVLDES